MNIFIKVFATDLRGPSSTMPLRLLFTDTGLPLTLYELKLQIEQTIQPMVRIRDQVLSLGKGGVIVSTNSVYDVDENFTPTQDNDS